MENNNNQIPENQNMDPNLLTLSLSSLYAAATTSAAVPTIPAPLFYYPPPESVPSLSHPTHTQRRPRRNPTGTPPPGKSPTLPPPYPWAGNRRCIIRSLADLISNNILFISGDVQCKKCDGRYKIQYRLEDKFREIDHFIAINQGNMNDRAPKIWMSPALPSCLICKESNSVRPVMAEKKKSINWLFLLLGQMLGICTLNQLKYYCKHTKVHRTGAKDRLVYSTYMGLCNQLQPNGPSRI